MRPNGTSYSLQGANRAFGRGWRGDAGHWPRAWLYDRHGVEVAGAFCEGSCGQLFGGRQSRRRSQINKDTARRILALLDAALPKGYANWTGPLIAKALGDVHVQYVWRFLRAQKIDLSGRKSWCQSNDPEFAAKAADIVGLYMAPPDNAIVLAVDEKPSIGARTRARLSEAAERARHDRPVADYKRHGTTTLFAALDVARGEVIARYKRRRRIEFLDFMNQIVAAYPQREIHVFLDNLSTHKPKRDVWLKRRER